MLRRLVVFKDEGQSPATEGRAMLGVFLYWIFPGGFM